MEIVNRENANYVILASDNFNQRQIFCKFFFHLKDTDSLSGALMVFAGGHPEIIKPNIRIDIYKVRNGNIIGGGNY